MGIAAGCPSVAGAASGALLFMDGQTSFSIPPQPLANALLALGRQADVQILTASNSIAGRRSTGTSGHLKVGVALTRLLEGTELDYEVIGARTVVIRQRELIPTTDPGHLDSINRSAPSVSVLDTVQVHGIMQSQLGFKADSSRSSTRTDAELADVPQSISIVTRDLIESRQAFEVTDVVRHVAGVDYVDGFGGPPLFRIRGFNVGNGLTDGMPNGVARIEDLPPLIGIERVEVLKGPETILGESSVDNNFGGTVNIVMKRPQAEPVRQLTFSSGNHDGTRLGVDLAGTFDEQDQLTYRLVAAGNRAGRSAQGYNGQRSTYLAPSLGWRGDTTQGLFGLEYIDNRVPVADHTVLLGHSLAESSPFNTLLGNPDDHARYRTGRVFYMAEQALGERWSLRSRGQYVSQRSNGKAWSFDDTQRLGLTNASASTYRYADTFYTLQNELAANFDQGTLVHDVLLGIDYARTHAGQDADASVMTLRGIVNFELLPGNALLSAGNQDLGVVQSRPLGGSWSTHTGVFVQDQLSIGEAWNVLATLRHATYALTNQAMPWTLHQSKWVPRLGVVYKITPDVSVYASSNAGFQVNALLGEDGSPLPPSMSHQIEAGTRLNLFDRRARLSAAWYRIKLDHSINRVSLESPHFAVPGPGQTNSGVELEFEGQILPGLDVAASFTEARIRNHDKSTPFGAPRHQGNVWVSYRFQQEALHAWTVAAGVFARSRAIGSADNGGNFALPGQASAEANLTYRHGPWQATLGVKNLFEHTLYAVNAESSFVPIRESRTFLLSGDYRF